MINNLCLELLEHIAYFLLLDGNDDMNSLLNFAKSCRATSKLLENHLFWCKILRLKCGVSISKQLNNDVIFTSLSSVKKIFIQDYNVVHTQNNLLFSPKFTTRLLLNDFTLHFCDKRCVYNINRIYKCLILAATIEHFQLMDAIYDHYLYFNVYNPDFTRVFSYLYFYFTPNVVNWIHSKFYFDTNVNSKQLLIDRFNRFITFPNHHNNGHKFNPNVDQLTILKKYNITDEIETGLRPMIEYMQKYEKLLSKNYSLSYLKLSKHTHNEICKLIDYFKDSKNFKSLFKMCVDHKIGGFGYLLELLYGFFPMECQHIIGDYTVMVTRWKFRAANNVMKCLQSQNEKSDRVVHYRKKEWLYKYTGELHTYYRFKYVIENNFSETQSYESTCKLVEILEKIRFDKYNNNDNNVKNNAHNIIRKKIKNNNAKQKYQQYYIYWD